MDVKQLRRKVPGLLAALVTLLGLGALILLGRSTQNSETFGRLQDWLLIINAAGALILIPSEAIARRRCTAVPHRRT